MATGDSPLGLRITPQILDLIATATGATPTAISKAITAGLPRIITSEDRPPGNCTRFCLWCGDDVIVIGRNTDHTYCRLSHRTAATKEWGRRLPPDGWGECPRPDKSRYETRGHATRAMRRARTDAPEYLNTYLCVCGWWHFGHRWDLMPKERSDQVDAYFEARRVS